jgi:hypothetical protein
MFQSGVFLLLPRPFTGSSLLTVVMLQRGAVSQLSVADAVTTTGIILLFGGHRTFGVAPTFFTTGGVVSATWMFCRQLLKLPHPSVAVQVRRIVDAWGHEPGLAASA